MKVFQHVIENGYFIFSIGRTFFNIGIGRALVPHFHQFHIEILGHMLRCFFWIGSSAHETVEPTVAAAKVVNTLVTKAQPVATLANVSKFARTHL